MYSQIKKTVAYILNFLAAGLIVISTNVSADNHPDKNIQPWGSAASLNITYKPQKVVFNVTTGNKAELKHILSRIAYLYQMEGSSPIDGSIIVILHGQSIPFFAIEHFSKNEAIMRQAQSLTIGTTIEFRMCRAAAKSFGFISMVPMADAEIIRLEHQGYAYMQ